MIGITVESSHILGHLKDNKVSITCNLLPCWINHRQSQLMFPLSSANGDMWLTTANQAANLSVSIIPRESEFLPVQQYLEKNKWKK